MAWASGVEFFKDSATFFPQRYGGLKIKKPFMTFFYELTKGFKFD